MPGLTRDLSRDEAAASTDRDRKKRIHFRILLFATSSVFVCGLLLAGEKGWRTGVARCEITPDEPLWLAGYASRTRPAEGTLHSLWAKVLALETPEGERAVIITSDLLGLPATISNRLSAQLQKRYRLGRDRIMLTSSHTHSGPVLSGALFDMYPIDPSQRHLIEQYSERLQTKIVETAGEAFSSMAPAQLYTGQGRTGFAVNRRNNREAEVPLLREKGVEPKGPVDHAVPVLAVRGPKGNLIAVLFSYACHATTLNSYVWSGDYPGVAQQLIEASHPGAVAMYHAGCGADQNPIPRLSVPLCEKYGAMLAAAVEEVLGNEMSLIPPRLCTSFKSISIDFERNPAPEELHKIESDPKASAYRKRWAARLSRSLEAGERLQRSYPYPVQVWLLGAQQLWIVLGGEVVVDYPIRFKREYGPATWVTGYANDVMAYIPSARIQSEGGYESSSMDVYGLAGVGWERNIEGRISGEVAKLVAEVRKRGSEQARAGR